MRALVGLLAWLAIKAGADIATPGQRWGHASVFGAATRLAELAAPVRPDKAGRLVPVPEEALEPDRSIVAHWALLAAVALVVLIVTGGLPAAALEGAREAARSALSLAGVGTPFRARALSLGVCSETSGPDDEVGDGLDIIEREHWRRAGLYIVIGGDGDDVRVAVREWVARLRCQPPDLDLWNGRALEAFDENDVRRAEQLCELLQRGCRSALALASELPLRRGDHGNVNRAGEGVAFAVGRAVVHAQLVMRVLDRRDAEPAAG
jgi:hypothetical protein